MQFIRTNSFEQFTNPERDAHHQMELLFSLDPNVEPDFASLVDIDQIPNSPQSQQSELSIMEDLDSIFEDVINSPVPSPSNTTTTTDDFFAPTQPNDNDDDDIDAIEPTICQVYPEIAEPPQPKHEPDMEIDEYATVDYDFTIATPPETPPTPQMKSSSRKTKLPVVERQQRKRKSNKESSRRYREKVKNRQADLIKSLDELIQKKRSIELDLAKTKAVNSFLVDQLRAKFSL